MSGNILFIHINEWGQFRSPDTIPISQAYQLAALRAQGFSGRILGDYAPGPQVTFMPGLPGESFAQACKTLDFVKANGAG